MARTQLLGLAVAALILSSTALASDTHIRWVVSPKEDQKIDHSMAERLYDEACQWVEDRFSPNGRPVQPTLVVHVGEACPQDNISNACVSPGTGEVFIPRWDKKAPGAIVHATIVLATMQLIQQEDIPGVVNSLLREYSRDFFDARSAAKR